MLRIISSRRRPVGPPFPPVEGLTGAQKVLLFGWILYLILTPLYVFPSGNPQPADFLMVGLILLVLSGFTVRVPMHTGLYICMALFLFVVALVNLFWWSIYYHTVSLKSILFYAYNASVAVFLVSIIERFRDRVLVATQVGLLAALLIETGVVLLLPSEGMRNIGTFNNPNQLGYWGLLIVACWLVARRDRRLGLLDLGVFVMAAYVVASSLSKAAMISFGIMIGLAAFSQGWRSGRLLGALGLLAVVGQLWFALPDGLQDKIGTVTWQSLVERIDKRFETLGRQGDDSLTGRGYQRIWHHPEYLFFGAGEGATYRFYQDNELHSTWGTLLFSYGITGFLLFISILIIVFRHASWRHPLYFSCIGLYGLTHQGLRDSLLWAFLGLVYGMARNGRATRRRAATSPNDATRSPLPTHRRRPARQGGIAPGIRPQSAPRAFEVG